MFLDVLKRKLQSTLNGINPSVSNTSYKKLANAYAATESFSCRGISTLVLSAISVFRTFDLQPQNRTGYILPNRELQT